MKHPVRNILSISLFIICLFGNTEFGQVVSVPELMKQYYQHHSANTHVNFIQFLAMHYPGDDGITPGDDEGSKLPFKQIQPFNFISFERPAEQGLQQLNRLVFIKKTYCFFTNHYEQKNPLQILLQPPRFVSCNNSTNI
jgi:hypothetical protein